MTSALTAREFSHKIEDEGASRVFSMAKRVRLSSEGVVYTIDTEPLVVLPNGNDIWFARLNLSVDGENGVQFVFVGRPTEPQMRRVLLGACNNPGTKVAETCRMLADIEGSELIIASLVMNGEEILLETVDIAGRLSVTAMIDGRGELAFAGKLPGKPLVDLRRVELRSIASNLGGP